MRVKTIVKGIILINRSFAKQIKVTKGKRNQKQTETEVTTFSVPFTLGEIKENITVNTNAPSKLSKEQIINQAFKFHSQGNISEATKYYQQIINQGFNDYRVFSNYGAILKQIGKLEEAELTTRKAIKLNPTLAESYNNLGLILKDLENLQEAESSTRKAIELRPDFANAYSNLGLILKDLGNLQEAESSTRKALELNPNFVEAHNNLGAILKDLNNLKEAEKHLLKAIEIRPEFAEAYNNLGNLMEDLDNLEKAEIYYNKAIHLRSDFKDALKNRWQLLFNKKEFNKALKTADLCNTKESKVLALETLFALGRIDEIYDRIAEMSQMEDENIYLAAFASFISYKEKRDNLHNFCQSPLSFLKVSNLKSYRNDYVQFINEIIKELYNTKTVWQPLNKATRNGFQTPSYINLFSKSPKYISQLKSIILEELDEYYSKYKKESCSYIQKWPSKRNLTAWHVILKKQGYQSAHIHPAGWLSGVIYLKVVPPLNQNEGAIEFSLNGEHYSSVDSPQLIHQPEVGDIVFFPSSLYHRTIPFSTDTDRIVIAFDLKPD